MRVNVTTSYDNPGEILLDPKLSIERKRQLLRQWAFDAYRFEVAATEGMPPSAPSRLDEAIDALIDLDEAGSRGSFRRSLISVHRKDAGAPAVSEETSTW